MMESTSNVWQPTLANTDESDPKTMMEGHVQNEILDSVGDTSNIHDSTMNILNYDADDNCFLSLSRVVDELDFNFAGEQDDEDRLRIEGDEYDIGNIVDTGDNDFLSLSRVVNDLDFDFSAEQDDEDCWFYGDDGKLTTKSGGNINGNVSSTNTSLSVHPPQESTLTNQKSAGGFTGTSEPTSVVENGSSSMNGNNIDELEDVLKGLEEDDDHDDENVDALLARGVHKLSLEKRNQAMYDLHGILELRPESPEEMTKLLEEMENEIQRLIKSKTTAENQEASHDITSSKLLQDGERNVTTSDEISIPYIVAETISYQYVHDVTFRMMFLRADRYNPLKAAVRIIKFFEVKQTLFGRDRLCRNITLQDIVDTEEGLVGMTSGYWPKPLYRDASGRPILVGYIDRRPETMTPLIHGRIVFYSIMNLLTNDEDAQRRGVVWLLLRMQRNTKSGGQHIREALPVHFNAMHLTFFDSPGNQNDNETNTHYKEESISHSHQTQAPRVQSMIKWSVPSALKSSYPSDGEIPSLMKNSEIKNNRGNNSTIANKVISYEPWKQSMKGTFSADIRARCRTHYGTESEILASLAVFGIPRQAAQGYEPYEYHMQWLHEQLKQDQRYHMIVYGGNGSSPFRDGSDISGCGSRLTGPSSVIPDAIPKPMMKKPLGVTSGHPMNLLENPMDSPGRNDQEMQHQQQHIETLSTEEVPIAAVGTVSNQRFATTIGSTIINPMPDDVLFGLSKTVKNHPGNVRFRQLVSMNMDVYYSASSNRSTKAGIAKAILKELTGPSGGRFLKRIKEEEEFGEIWVEVDSREAQAKVAHHFRNRRKAIVKASKKKITNTQ